MNMGPYEQGLVQSYNQAHLRLVNQPKTTLKVVIIDPDQAIKAERDKLLIERNQLRDNLYTAKKEINELSTALYHSPNYQFITNPVRKIIDLICCNEKVS